MNYKLYKGHHFCLHPIKFHYNKPSLEFMVNFNDDCKYENNDGSINKLFGISWGYHMNNSFRIGWNILNDQLHIYGFAHENEGKITSSLGIIPFNKDILIKIDFRRNLEIIVVKWTYDWVQYSDHMDYTYPDIKFGYYLWPFFGGKKSCPHNMHIKLIQK